MIQKKTFNTPELRFYALSRNNIVCTSSSNVQLRSMDETVDNSWD